MIAPGWIGVDLDGTLAHFDRWRGEEHIGEPVPTMLERVKAWLAAGRVVKIVTARVAPASDPNGTQRGHVKAWLAAHGLGELEVTHGKDFDMAELWDDRAVGVEPNSGRPVAEAERDALHAELKRIASDYIPDNDGQAPLALDQMREAIRALAAREEEGRG